jgi:pimeloyl-ACP methyl ester carboxylesterase
MLKLSLLPQGAKFPDGFSCQAQPASCQFDLVYFLNDGFNPANKTRLNILFIAGGPGAIVDPDSPNPTFNVWRKKHNLVYFHPRGMGQSKLNGDKRYDQFLRVDYVVEDIESLRAKILGNRPWDAIYAHSWGTVVAQRYAAKYGKPKLAEPKVKRLILSGPVDRHLANSQEARIRTVSANFKMIYDYFRSAGGAEQCTCDSNSFLKPLLTDAGSEQAGTFEDRADKTDNLCYLKLADSKKIADDLEGVLRDIDRFYGSADQIVDNFKALGKDDAFQKRFGKFDVNFFVALRYLQLSGAPEKGGLVFSVDSHTQVSAALVVVQQLATPKPESCKVKTSPFAAAQGLCDGCARLAKAQKDMTPRDDRTSLRGQYVFGVYDGVTRWLPGMMEKSGCFTGKDIAEFVNHGSAEKKFGRDQARRIGVVPGDQICPWDPAKFRHAVPTLLLKGSRDAVVAGCQAEDFFRNGLTDGRRVLFEFRGMGHDLSVARLSKPGGVSDWAEKFADLLETFIEKADDLANFRSDEKVEGMINKFKITDQTVAAKKPCSA